jgi:putative metalloenzyme radical SAM/SPASM domain maturase
MKHLIVETSSRCNLSCPMCIRQSWEEPTGDMNLETFRSLLSSSSELESLTLTGYGESFLNPHLIDMIHLARRWLPTDAKVNLTSNGTFLDPELIEETLKAGLDGIALSIDSLQEDKFQLLRGGASLELIVECLDTLVTRKERLNKSAFVIGLSFVAMERNIRELPRLLEFAATHGVNSVWVNNLLPHTESFVSETLYDSHSQEVLRRFNVIRERLRKLGLDSDRFHHRVVSSFTSKGCSEHLFPSEKLPPEEDVILQLAHEMASGALSMGGTYQSMFALLERDQTRFDSFRKVFEESQALACSLNLELHLPLLIPRTERECNFVKRKTCLVTWDGWVRPCSQLAHDYTCFHYGRAKRVKSITFGKAPEQDLKAIWESQQYREFRRLVEAFPFSPCGDCGLSDGCGYIDFDADFLYDCNMYEQPCGDCLWSRGLLQCP